VILIVAEPVRRVISLATVMLVARYLSVDDFGTYQFAAAIVTIASVLAAFGTNAFVIREIARDPKSAGGLVGGVFGARTTMYAVTAVLIAAFALARGYEPVKLQVILLVTVGLLFNDMEDVCVSIFDGFQRMDLAALTAIVHAAATLAATGVVIGLGADVRAMAAAYVVSHAVGLGFAAYLVTSRLTAVRFDFSARTFWKVIRAGWPFLTINILWITSFHIDKVMLGELLDDRAVGYYGAAYRLFEVLISIPILLGRALYPAFSAQVATDDAEGMKRLFANGIRAMGLIALPICVGVVFTGTPVMVLLFGAKYAPSGPTLSILGAILWMFFLSTSSGWALTAMNRLGWIFTANAVATTVNIAANFYFIPRWSFNGAAVVTGLSEFVLMTSYLLLAQRKLRFFRADLIPWRPALAALLMGAGLYGGSLLVADRTALVQVAVLVPGGAAIYAVGLWITGSFGEMERDVLHKLAARFRRRRSA
jgi:O-antigen/teichoic acid export membrane protein